MTDSSSVVDEARLRDYRSRCGSLDEQEGNRRSVWKAGGLAEETGFRLWKNCGAMQEAI